MDTYKLEGIELMGENVKDKLRSCGEGVKIYPMAKIAFPHVVDLGNHSKIRDFAFIFAGEGVTIGEYTDVQPHTIIWGGGVTVIGGSCIDRSRYCLIVTNLFSCCRPQDG